MAVRFSIRNGNRDPGSSELNDYELGLNWANADKPRLFTKTSNGIKEVAAGDANTLDGINSIDFARLDGTPGDLGSIPEDTVLGRASGKAIFNGDVKVVGRLYATAESALYADIAEYYETKNIQIPGQILMFGTEFEGEIADGTMPLLGVCSTNPAYTMNDQISESEVEHYAPIALKGRIPINITGEAKRGQYIIVDTENPGFGKAVKKITKTLDRDCNFIGICLTDSENGQCEVKV